MTAALDTNILLRLTLGDVPEQTKAVEKILTEHNSFHVADVAIFEMVFVLEKVYRLPRTQVAKSVLAIVRNPSFNCNQRLFELTLPLYVAETKLSIIDCALTKYAELSGTTPLLTFDVALATSCPEHTKLLSPEETAEHQKKISKGHGHRPQEG
jgi:predicted nucleic-acid-binding protein